MKRDIRIGLDNDTRWAYILEQLQSVEGHRQQQGAKEYRLANQLLEVRDCTGKHRRWEIGYFRCAEY